MKPRIQHIISHGLRIFLMLFWLYVALDKLWNLPQFHHALLQQPFPDQWANILYWLLPIVELFIALLFIPLRSTSLQISTPISIRTRRARNLSLLDVPYILSALMLVIFSVYIALGLSDFYEEKPCGCASALSNLSWGWHLIVNISILLLSLWGWNLHHNSSNTVASRKKEKKTIRLFLPYIIIDVICFISCVNTVIDMFRMLFALFPGRPVFI